MMNEQVLSPGHHPLVSLITPSIFDFRHCSNWIYRYEHNNKPHWEKQVDKIRTVYQEYGASAPILFLSTTPSEKRKLIELMSKFGKPSDEELASEMIGQAMRQYSDPGGGAPIAEQQDFYSHELTTTPSVFLHGLDLFFEITRQETQRQEYLDLLLELRGEAAIPGVPNPHYEQGFIKKHVNGMGLPSKEEWEQHYKRNEDIYLFFGLTFDKGIGRLLRIGEPVPPAQVLDVH